MPLQEYLDYFMDYSLEILYLKNLRQELLKEARGRILELAVGNGQNSLHYPRNSKIIAIDITHNRITKSKKRPKSTDYVVGDSEILPFQDNSFDTIIDTLALCTYKEPKKALEEMSRVCKPKGTILLLEHGISKVNFIKNYQIRNLENHFAKAGCNWARNPFELVKQSRLKITSYERKLLGMVYLIWARPN